MYEVLRESIKGERVLTFKVTRDLLYLSQFYLRTQILRTKASKK